MRTPQVTMLVEMRLYCLCPGVWENTADVVAHYQSTEMFWWENIGSLQFLEHFWDEKCSKLAPVQKALLWFVEPCRSWSFTTQTSLLHNSDPVPSCRWRCDCWRRRFWIRATWWSCWANVRLQRSRHMRSLWRERGAWTRTQLCQRVWKTGTRRGRTRRRARTSRWPVRSLEECPSRTLWWTNELWLVSFI